jgi:hypothetical protein
LGPNFIGVHEMIDPQVELVRGYADEVAERTAALGFSPQGTRGPRDQFSPMACASTGLLRMTISGSALVNGKFGRSSMWTLNVAASTSRE